MRCDPIGRCESSTQAATSKALRKGDAEKQTDSSTCLVVGPAEKDRIHAGKCRHEGRLGGGVTERVDLPTHAGHKAKGVV